MIRLSCHDCQSPIPNGEAVLRSIDFVQVAFHAGCWAARVIPAQRQPVEDGSVTR